MISSDLRAPDLVASRTIRRTSQQPCRKSLAAVHVCLCTRAGLNVREHRVKMTWLLGITDSSLKDFAVQLLWNPCCLE